MMTRREMKELLRLEKKKAEARTPDWAKNANPEQLAAIEHTIGPACVMAVPGSGKTRIVCCRIARLVTHCKVDGKRILATTFSKKAADEMNERVQKLGVYNARVGTWHSLCFQILREDRTEWAQWDVDEHNRAKTVLKEILGFKHMKWNSADLGMVIRFIGICKANLWDPPSPEAALHAAKEFRFKSKKALEAFHIYNEHIASKQLLTYDDFLVFAAQHLSDEQNRKKWASKFDYLITDEKQDDARAQQVLSEYLARDHRNIMVTGDLNQSIFGFRASSPMYMANFSTDWPGAKIYGLPRNYRSGKLILEAANRVIQKAQPIANHRPQMMVGERKEDGKVIVLENESIEDEANSIVDLIYKSTLSGDTDYDDHVILYRCNSQSRAFEEAFIQRRIPYLVIGGISFYERGEIRDLLAYLRVAEGKGNEKNIRRCINSPFRFLGQAFVEALLELAEEEQSKNWPDLIVKAAAQGNPQQRQRYLASAQSWAQLITSVSTRIQIAKKEDASPHEKREASPSMILSDIVRETKYLEWIKKEEGEESLENSPASNVHELIRMAEKFPTVRELLKYIAKMIKASKEQRKDAQAGGERVLLMSCHRSKALQFPHVYVATLNEGIFPHPRGDQEEERRLVYVAMTRAENVLYLSYVRRMMSSTGIRDAHPSSFLIDAMPSAPKFELSSQELEIDSDSIETNGISPPT